MKPEQSEQFFIEELFNQSIKASEIPNCNLVNIDKLTGDASTRRYYRLYTNLGTYVVCLDNPTVNNESNTFIAKQKFFEKIGLRVPKIFDFNESKGYILEEDLGDKTLLSILGEVQDLTVEYDLYKELIDSLLKLHSLDQMLVEKSQEFTLKFDFEKYISEIDVTIEYFIKGFLKVSDSNFQIKIRNLFLPICKRLANEKMVLTHRDFHSRNVMCKEDELIIIDFQDARMGIPQYDLVSLLDDCYYEIDKNAKDKLIKYYFDNLDPSLHGQNSYENFLELYQDMALQRVFKAIGSFSFIYQTRADHRYLKYIGFAMEKIRKIMLNNNRYAELRQELFRVYYES